MLDENSTWSPSQQQQTVPLSPSKRRQSTCHYEDLQAKSIETPINHGI